MLGDNIQKVYDGKEWLHHLLHNATYLSYTSNSCHY